MLVVVVIGIIATTVLPRFMTKKPADQWEAVLDEINNLVYFARQEAISKQRVYRIHFKSTRKANDIAIVEIESDDPDKPGKKIYSPVESYYFKPKYTFPSSITLQAVFHGKEEQLSQNKQNAFCYVIPNGLVQEIFIHLLKTEDEKQTKVTFKVSPFFGKFEMLKGFVKPKR